MVGEAARGVAHPIDTRPLTVREAEEEFTARIAALQDEHQKALEQAYQNGYHDGAAMAGAEKAASAERMGAILDAMGEEFTRTRRDWYATNERQIVELICLALEKIIGDRPPVGERIGHAMREAFSRLTAGDRVTIRCHPQDLAYVQQLLSQKMDDFSGFRHIRVVADEHVGISGCLVETDLGVVDARVEQQLSVLKGSLLAVVPKDTEIEAPRFGADRTPLAQSDAANDGEHS